jgi:hypothetical protein
VLVITAGFLLFGRGVLWPLDAALRLLPVPAPVSLDSFLVGGAAALGIVKPPAEVPVTLVAIDDALHAQWGRPCITPREAVTRLIGAVAAQRPSAIVVDINFDCELPNGAVCPAETGCDLGAFFAGYTGPPLILVRGLYADSVGAAEPQVRVRRTAYEAAVASNPRIQWAHTFYVTDLDGTVRRWRDVWEACTDADGTETLLAVPVRVTAALRGETSLPAEPSRAGNCSFDSQSSAEHLVVLGTPIVGAPASTGSATANAAPRVLPARFLLDEERAVQPGGYFTVTDRVAIIGATHAASGDVWRTAIGLIPGAELIAHTVRFAPTQLGRAASGGYSRTFVVAALWTLAALAFLLRPSLVVVLAGVASFTAIAIAAAAARFDIFESLELSLWLFLEYAVAFAFWMLYREVKNYRGWRTLRLLMSKRMRAADPEAK